MKSNLTIAILLFLIASTTLSVKLFRGTKQYPMTYAHTQDPQGSTNGTFNLQIQLPLTYDSNSGDSPLYKLRPDLGVHAVFHGVNPPDEWGINCSGDESTNCNIEDPEAQNYQSYYGWQFYWMPGKTYFTLEGSQPDMEKDAMDISLINHPTEKVAWQFEDTGLLGLSPQSPFWTYLFNQYLPMNDTLAFSFYLNTDDSNYWYQLFSGEYEGVFNGSSFKLAESPEELLDYEAEDETISWAEGLDSGYWGIKDAKIWISSNMTAPLHDGDACISSTSPHLFISDQFDDIQKLVSVSMCGDDICGSEAAVNLAPEFYITFTDTNGTLQNVTIRHSDYLYADVNGTLVPSFDDMSAYQKDSCPIDSRFGLGRMFLFKRLLLFKLQDDPERTTTKTYVSINYYSERPSLAKLADVWSLVLSSFITIVLITAFIMYLRMGSNPDKPVVAEGYRSTFKTRDDEEHELDLAGEDEPELRD